ncbi:MAG: AbrB/MazE/SpoVT family DNA-binding domain-containing protein [Myxococcota bacterium]
METKLSSKGQIVLPQALRDSRGWKSGQRFDVQIRDDTVVLTPIASEPSISLDELIGCVDYKGPKRSIEEMDAALRARLKKSVGR